MGDGKIGEESGCMLAFQVQNSKVRNNFLLVLEKRANPLKSVSAFTLEELNKLAPRGYLWLLMVSHSIRSFVKYCFWHEEIKFMSPCHPSIT